ncbi:hypothetical protein D4R99_04340 [bacterium]|nr:MAG: hypothetical protein D4R99_04340 [bacterium]
MKLSKTKYYTTVALIIISIVTLGFLVYRNFYSLTTYRVYLLSPDNRALIATDFTASVMITGSRSPGYIDIFIDGNQTQSLDFDSLRYTELGSFRLANLGIKTEKLNEGKHSLEIILRAGILNKERRVASEFSYERINPFPNTVSETESKKMEKYFGGEVTELIIKLNDARYYYTNSDWRKSESYLKVKNKVIESDVNPLIKEKLKRLIEEIEKKSEVIDVDNTANSLNLALHNSGYSVLTLMFEYRYLNGESRSLLLSYKSIDTLRINSGGVYEKAFELLRLDSIKQREQFLGIKLANSPFAVVLNDNTRKLSDEYSRIILGSDPEARKELNSQLNYYTQNIDTLNLLINLITREAGNKPDVFSIVRNSNAVHEVKHLWDYKHATPIGKSVKKVLDYFYGEITDDNSLVRDSALARERNIAGTLMRINPEYSAFLFELANAGGMRRLTLLTLFEKIKNKNKEDTPHHWAAKLILYNLAARHGIPAEGLLNNRAQGNEDKWFDLTLKLLRLEPDEIGKDAAAIMETEFGK